MIIIHGDASYECSANGWVEVGEKVILNPSRFESPAWNVSASGDCGEECSQSYQVWSRPDSIVHGTPASSGYDCTYHLPIRARENQLWDSIVNSRFKEVARRCILIGTEQNMEELLRQEGWLSEENYVADICSPFGETETA